MTELDLAFEALAKAFLASHPEVRHEWRIAHSEFNVSRRDLVCGQDEENEVFASLLGFQVAVGLTNGRHDDFERFGRSVTEQQVAREAFATFVDLLTKHGQLSRPQKAN